MDRRHSVKIIGSAALALSAGPVASACRGVVRADLARQTDEGSATEILKAARNEPIDLLVVGCHRGEGGPQSQALASRLLRRAACAVLTVPI